MEQQATTTRRQGDIVIVDLKGPTCLVSEDELLALVARLLDEGVSKMVLSFEHLTHVDSASICGMVRAHTAVTKQGGTFKLVNLQPRVRRVFDATRLSTVLEIYGSEADAIQSFEASRSVSR
jgi:anti-sigma B factor antagonist